MENAGFSIIDSVTRTNENGTSGVALGYRETQFGPEWVTWDFSRRNGINNYYWGHYIRDEKAAKADYLDRINRLMKED